MKPTELKQLIRDLVLNQTDTAKLTEGLDQIAEKYEEVYTTRETVTETNTKLQEQNASLMKVNHDFFMRLHTPAPAGKEEEEEKEVTTDDAVKELEGII